MNGNIPSLFDFWDDPFVHLLLLKSSMVSSVLSDFWNRFLSFQFVSLSDGVMLVTPLLRKTCLVVGLILLPISFHSFHSFQSVLSFLKRNVFFLSFIFSFNTSHDSRWMTAIGKNQFFKT